MERVLVFEKIAKPTDVRVRFSFPTSSLMFLPRFEEGAHAMDFTVMDNSGHVWNFRCSTRRNGYKKPVLSAGWLRFVHHYDVSVNDKIVLFWEPGNVTGVHYKIEIKRKIKLHGIDGWVDVVPLSLFV